MELLSQSRTKPNLDQIRKIKSTLRQALKLSEEDTITVTELACLEEDCAPLETVIGLLRDDHPQIQHKIQNQQTPLIPTISKKFAKLGDLILLIWLL